MTLPTLFFAFILSTIYGAAFHLWQGGGAGRLLLYLLSGWLGFGLGHFVGEWGGLTLFQVGELNLLTATIASIIALFAARWLALPVVAANERAKRRTAAAEAKQNEK